MTTETPHNYSIILADDDRFLLDMYTKKFSDEGYTVESCLAVHEVISAIEGGFKADAVIFDLVMPQEDGFDLLRTVREKGWEKDMVLIALTNQSAEEEQAKTEELGADAFIVKATMIPSEVFKKVDELITEKRKIS